MCYEVEGKASVGRLGRPTELFSTVSVKSVDACLSVSEKLLLLHVHNVSRVQHGNRCRACCGADVRRLPVREQGNQRNERRSQGQRVIRLFSVRPGKLSSLGDGK